MKDALLEVGSEELPASFIGLGMTQLKDLAESSLKEHSLSFQSVSVYGTPRRLAVVLTGLADKSLDQRRTIPGPPVAKAKDAAGQWTPAAAGFAGKHGLQPNELIIENDRLCAVMQIKGTPTRQLLAQLFPLWIQNLQFPKTMTWEPSHFRFPRPIRWITALYGHDVVRFQLAGVSSGKSTFGLGFQAAKKIIITQPAKYAGLLKNQCVMVEPAARQEAIRRLAEQAVKRVHGRVLMSESLLEQVSNLVEHPVAILGGFDPAYLDLPKEVLITCLEHHQKFFPVESVSGGKLLPHFIGIRNGMSLHQDIVREGYERVLAARLADARFFYNHDRKTPLSSKVDALQGVMFQEKLGNLFEKKERVKRLLETFPPDTGISKILDKAKRVADLCKADLVTDMVREFPELQGVMARLYAQADDEQADIAQALEEHYWPITLSGALPSSDIAAFVALADKLDTLAGDFAVGLIPSGSADPYGLRRAAVGVLRILESTKCSLGLEWFVNNAVKIQPENVKEGWRQTETMLNQFMRQRFAALMVERGYKADEIDTVLVGGVNAVVVTVEKIKALHELRKSPEFEKLTNLFKRTSNIVRQARDKKIPLNDGDMPQADLLREDCERELWRTYTDVRARIQDVAGFEKILKAMVPLSQPLAGFFDGVMVMVDDESLRINRLRLLYRISRLFELVGDFSKLQNV